MMFFVSTAGHRDLHSFPTRRSSDLDVLVVVAYGEILPEDVLSVPRLMPVNVHFSLLPALRGAAPVQRAILDGLRETGVTTRSEERRVGKECRYRWAAYP